MKRTKIKQMYISVSISEWNIIEFVNQRVCFIEELKRWRIHKCSLQQFTSMGKYYPSSNNHAININSSLQSVSLSTVPWRDPGKNRPISIPLLVYRADLRMRCNKVSLCGMIKTLLC
jgi:hypothetical protein